MPQLSDDCGVVNIPKSRYWGPSQIQLKQTLAFSSPLYFGDFSNSIMKLRLMTQDIKVDTHNTYLKSFSHFKHSYNLSASPWFTLGKVAINARGVDTADLLVSGSWRQILFLSQGDKPCELRD